MCRNILPPSRSWAYGTASPIPGLLLSRRVAHFLAGVYNALHAQFITAGVLTQTDVVERIRDRTAKWARDTYPAAGRTRRDVGHLWDALVGMLRKAYPMLGNPMAWSSIRPSEQKSQRKALTSALISKWPCPVLTDSIAKLPRLLRPVV